MRACLAATLLLRFKEQRTQCQTDENHGEALARYEAWSLSESKSAGALQPFPFMRVRRSGHPHITLCFLTGHRTHRRGSRAPAKHAKSEASGALLALLPSAIRQRVRSRPPGIRSRPPQSPHRTPGAKSP